MSDLVKGQGSAAAPASAVASNRAVLAEETFIADLEKIVERDFYPDLPRLRAKQRYLEAREGALAASGAAAAAAATATSAGGFSTPTPMPTPAPTPSNGAAAAAATAAAGLAAAAAAAAVGEAALSSRMSTASDATTAKAATATAMSGISLDSYLCGNTSEDNASFQALLDESERRRRIKYAWFYDREKATSSSSSTLAIEGGGGDLAIQDPGQGQGPLTAGLDSWQGYRVLNAFMYSPDVEIGAGNAVRPASREAPLASKASSEGRKIVHENTRFRRLPFPGGRSQWATGAGSGAASALPVSLFTGGSVSRFGTDGLELRPKTTTTAAAAAAAGAGGVPAYLATPSPAPGVDESPLMTWGDIDGTPFRIDEDANSGLLLEPSSASSAAAAAASLPYFRIPAQPTVQLADKLGRQRRLARQRDLAANAGSGRSGEQASVGMKSPSRMAMGLSPAARQLLRRAAGIGLANSGGGGGGGASSVDKALRASYRGGGDSARMSSSSGGGGSSRRSTASSLTDGLLGGGGGGGGGSNLGTPR